MNIVNKQESSFSLAKHKLLAKVAVELGSQLLLAGLLRSWEGAANFVKCL